MTQPLAIPRTGNGRNQGLRTALSLAALTGQPVCLQGVQGDAQRPNPGAEAGALACLRAATWACAGRSEGEHGDNDLVLVPGRPRSGDFSLEIGGPAPLAGPLESALLPLSAAGGRSSLILGGGTHIQGALTSEELTRSIVPMWRVLGLEVGFTEMAPGFLPRARGEAEASVGPSQGVRPLRANDPFQARKVGVEVMLSGLPVHLAEQALEGAAARLEVHGLQAETHIRKAHGAIGLSVCVWAHGDGVAVAFAALGQRGGRPGAVATTAAESLMSFLESGAAVPARLAAPLIAPLVAARGMSRLLVDALSPPLKAALSVAETFYPECVNYLPSRPGEPVEMRIQGQSLL